MFRKLIKHRLHRYLLPKISVTGGKQRPVRENAAAVCALPLKKSKRLAAFVKSAAKYALLYAAAEAAHRNKAVRRYVVDANVPVNENLERTSAQRISTAEKRGHIFPEAVVLEHPFNQLLLAVVGAVNIRLTAERKRRQTVAQHLCAAKHAHTPLALAVKPRALHIRPRRLTLVNIGAGSYHRAVIFLFVGDFRLGERPLRLRNYAQSYHSFLSHNVKDILHSPLRGILLSVKAVNVHTAVVQPPVKASALPHSLRKCGNSVLALCKNFVAAVA